MLGCRTQAAGTQQLGRYSPREDDAKLCHPLPELIPLFFWQHFHSTAQQAEPRVRSRCHKIVGVIGTVNTRGTAMPARSPVPRQGNDSTAGQQCCQPMESQPEVPRRGHQQHPQNEPDRARPFQRVPRAQSDTDPWARSICCPGQVVLLSCFGDAFPAKSNPVTFSRELPRATASPRGTTRRGRVARIHSFCKVSAKTREYHSLCQHLFTEHIPIFQFHDGASWEPSSQTTAS